MPPPTSISVIVRTVDRNEKLAEALASLARQTLQKFETVIIDMTPDGVDQVLNNYPNQLSLIRHLRFGKALPRAQALNEGIREASSPMIAILDDDNVYDPRHLETLVEGLQSTNADLVYTGVRRVTYTRAGEQIEVTEWHQPYDLNQLLVGNYIHTAGTAFLKSTWQRVGGYDARFPVYEDYDFLLRVAATGKIARLPAATAESRSFTGMAGVQHHALRESQDVMRCQAGIRWKHRAMFASSEARSAIMLKMGNDVTNVSRLTKFFSKLHLRSEKALDLLGWWWYHSLPYRNRSRF